MSISSSKSKVLIAGMLMAGALACPTLGHSAPTYTRRNIYSLSSADIDILRHGVAVMKSRLASDPTSWAYQANIHGTYTTPPQPLWNQCQHGSYFFLSWHRMYVYYFERILRKACGHTDFALPYWNYTNPSQNALPPGFGTPTTNNALYTPLRAPGINNGTTVLPASATSYSVAFTYTNFTAPTGSSASFGGQLVTGPVHFSRPHGQLEQQPHDIIHVLLGGTGGLMTDPNTAAQDPIFWMHHSNIDRLWNLWIQLGGGRSDPSDNLWQTQKFSFYDENGTQVTLTGAQIMNTATQLDYRYDSDPPVLSIINVRTIPQPIPLFDPVAVYAKAAPIELAAAQRTYNLSIQPRFSAEFERRLKSRSSSQSVTLDIEAIKFDKVPGYAFQVYLNLPKGAKADPAGPYFVGNFSLFGMKPHHESADHPWPGGLVSFDVTRQLARLSTGSRRSGKKLQVTILPLVLQDRKGNPVPIQREVQAQFGAIRLKLYRSAMGKRD